MKELLKKYNLKQSQFNYELKRANKNNLSIEDWLRFRFSKKNSELVSKNNKIVGRSLVVDILDNFGNETGFLLDKNLRKRFCDFLINHKSYNIFVYNSDDLEQQRTRLMKGLGVKYDYFDIQELGQKEFDTLCDLEITIKNTELFWVLFGHFRHFFRFLTHKEKEIKRMLKRYDRSNVSLIYRTQWIEFFSNVGRLGFNKNWKDLDFYNEKSVKDLIELNKKYGDLDYIKIYRGFKLQKGDGNIRDKLNKNKQKFGKGFYYTLNRDYGIFYTMNSNIWGHLNYYLHNLTDYQLENSSHFHLRELGRLKIDREKFTYDKKYRKEILNTKEYREFYDNQTHIVHSSKDVDRMNTSEEDRSLIGTYKVRKKDILFYSDMDKTTFNKNVHEEAVFCFDDDVDLVRYDYLSQKDYSNINKLNIKLSTRRL